MYTIISDDDDSYDELEMYETLGVYDINVVSSNPESKKLPTTNSNIFNGFETEALDVVMENEIDAYREKERRKFRKVRCSKLQNWRKQQNVTRNKTVPQYHTISDPNSEHSVKRNGSTEVCNKNDMSENNVKYVDNEIDERKDIDILQNECAAKESSEGEENMDYCIPVKFQNSRREDIDNQTFDSMKFNRPVHDMDSKAKKFRNFNTSTLSLLKQTAENVEPDTKTLDMETISSAMQMQNTNMEGNKKLKRETKPMEKEIKCTKIKYKGRTMYQCDVCSKMVRDKYWMKKHYSACTGEKVEKRKQFLEKIRFTEMNQNGCKMYQCDICSKTLKPKSFQRLKDHSTVHTNEKSYKCEECGDSFRLECTLRSHKINKHSAERKYICSICCKSYKHPYYLKMHMNIHTNTRFYCDICGSDYSALQTLKEHIYQHLGSLSNQDLLTCEVCKKNFATKNSLKLHIQTHDGTQEFSCDLCGALFSRKADRDRHRMGHTGERPFKCGKCNYSSIRLGDLNRHKLKHGDQSGGQKRQKCPYCEKTLIRKDEMNAHIATHLTVNEAHLFSIKHSSIPCRICQKYFVTKYQLSKHSAEVHRKFIECDECGQIFKTISNRNRHMKRAHGDEEVSCTICKKIFKSKANLYDHCRFVHPDKQIP